MLLYSLLLLAQILMWTDLSSHLCEPWVRLCNGRSVGYGIFWQRRRRRCGRFEKVVRERAGHRDSPHRIKVEQPNDEIEELDAKIVGDVGHTVVDFDDILLHYIEASVPSLEHDALHLRSMASSP